MGDTKETEGNVHVEKGAHTPLLSHKCKGWHCKKCPTLWKYWITGEDLRGPGDNATWRLDATQDYRGLPLPKLKRARWRRVTRRWAFGAVPPLLAGTSTTGILPSWTLQAYGAGALGVGAWLAQGALRRWWPDRRNLRQYVRPAAKVLCDHIGIPYQRRYAAKMISLPAHFGQGRDTDGTVAEAVRVTLPGVRQLTDGQKATLVKALAFQLGIPGATAAWRMAGPLTQVDLTPAAVPPRTLTFADVRKHLEEADPEVPFVGLAAGRRPIHGDLRQDSPHGALSGPSGTGKSALLKVLLCQRGAGGSGILMLDYKRWSHSWLHGLPNNRVEYAYRIEHIHEALCRAGRLLHDRIECDSAEELATRRDYDIVVEEINSTIKMLNRYWRGLRQERTVAAQALKKEAVALQEESDGMLSFEEACAAVGLDVRELALPLQSPAVDALQEIVQMGRQFRIHVWAAAQRLSAAVFGGNGGDVRESFALRFVARWDLKLWKMLIDGLKYVACPAGPRGIWGVQIGEEFHVFRVPWLEDSEARAFLLRGAAPDAPLFQEDSLVAAAPPVIEQEKTLALPTWVKLSDALAFLPADEGGNQLSLEAIRKASQRDGFPEPLEEKAPDGARLYVLQDLLNWRERRLAITR